MKLGIFPNTEPRVNIWIQFCKSNKDNGPHRKKETKTGNIRLSEGSIWIMILKLLRVFLVQVLYTFYVDKHGKN